MAKDYRKEDARARFFNELMGVQEAADHKGRHFLTVRKSIHAGTLAGHQVGFYYVIPRYAVEQWTGSSIRDESEPPMQLRPQEQNLLADLITSRQAAHLKGVAESSVLKAIKAGKLNGKQIGKPWIVSREEVEAWTPSGHCPKGWRKEKAETVRRTTA